VRCNSCQVWPQLEYVVVVSAVAVIWLTEHSARAK
jgi:hypothetical protein